MGRVRALPPDGPPGTIGGQWQNAPPQLTALHAGLIPASAFRNLRSWMMTFKLSTLTIALGAAYAAPQVYALTNPRGYADWLRKFPRNIPLGVLLVLLGTAWFLYNLSLESIADFAAFKPHMMVAFAAIGLGTCIVVHDFLAVRGLAVLLLLLAKLMVDTGSPHLADSSWVLVNQAWAYIFVVAGIWFTISPWRLRDWIAWNTANENRLRAVSLIRLAFGVFVAVLGAVVFRPFV
jgi:hypothetical protein